MTYQSRKTLSTSEGHDKFREIIKKLKHIKQEEALGNLDNILFDGAVRIYNSLLINRQSGWKDIHLNAESPGENKTEKEQPMTEKQRHLLENLKYGGDMNLTKQQAMKIIQQHLEEQKET